MSFYFLELEEMRHLETGQSKVGMKRNEGSIAQSLKPFGISLNRQALAHILSFLPDAMPTDGRSGAMRLRRIRHKGNCMYNTAFSVACEVEKAGCDIILPYIESKGFKVIPFANKHLQQYGDYIVQNGDKPKTIEIKTENKHTGNFFFETWSNRKWHTLGWIFTIQADWLFYYFQDKYILYFMQVKSLKDCLFIDGLLWKYPEVEQGKYNQRNDTWGRIVPVDEIMSHKTHEKGRWCTETSLPPF